MRGFVFIKNTVILTATSFVLRIIGMLFKIYIAGEIGSEGIGLYSLIMSVYMLASIFATCGICTGVTKIISEKGDIGAAGAKRVVLLGSAVTLFISFFISGGLYISAPMLANYLIKDARATLSLKIIAFILPIKGLGSILDGYFYARRKTLAPCLADLIEQIVRIGSVVLLVGFVFIKDIRLSAAALIIGDGVGEAAALIFVFIAYLKDKKNLSGNAVPKGILNKILRLMAPIIGSRYVTTALHTAESLIVPTLLTVYTSDRVRSVSEYGMLKGMALPTLFFPAAFLSSVSLLLLPEISEAAAKGNKLAVKSLVNRSVSLTVILSIPIAAIMFSSGEAMGILLFDSAEVGKIIKILSLIIPFMYIESAGDGIMKGLGLQRFAFRYNAIDSAIRLLLTYLLVPRMGLIGFLTVMIISNIFTASFSTAKILRSAEIRLNISNTVIKPLFGSAIGGLFSNIIIKAFNLSPIPSIFLSALLVIACFALSLYLLGGLDGSLLPQEIRIRAKKKTD